MCGCGCGWPGIDKPDVHYVVFCGLLQLMVQFHQGVGWDGKRADGVIFWNYRAKSEVLKVQRS
jgi:superfamily II DNA helicase RecQ